MKVQEFKLRMINGVNTLIDDYFGSNNVTDKFINSTLKIMVKQNANKVDGISDLFADEDGCIDESIILEEYGKTLGETGIIFDIRDFVKNDMVRGLLPNKALIIKKEDLHKMFAPVIPSTNTIYNHDK